MRMHFIHLWIEQADKISAGQTIFYEYKKEVLFEITNFVEEEATPKDRI